MGLCVQDVLLPAEPPEILLRASYAGFQVHSTPLKAKMKSTVQRITKEIAS